MHSSFTQNSRRRCQLNNSGFLQAYHEFISDPDQRFQELVVNVYLTLVLGRSYFETRPDRSIPATNGGLCLRANRWMRDFALMSMAAKSCPVAFLARTTSIFDRCSFIALSSAARYRIFLSLVIASHSLRPTNAIHSSSGAFSAK